MPTPGGRTAPPALSGPKGTALSAEGLRAAYLSDIETRLPDEHVPEGGTRSEAHEPEPSVGCRIDHGGRPVVFRGDAAFDRRVVEAGRGVDLAVHEAGGASVSAMENPIIRTILDHRTSSEDAGRVFAEAEPGMAVCSHVVRLFGPEGRNPTAEVLARTRATCDGPLATVEDLMRFILTEGGVALLKAGD